MSSPVRPAEQVPASSAQQQVEVLISRYSQSNRHQSAYESQVEQGLKLLKSAEEEGSSSLIGRQWRVVCAISIISYIVIQILISYSASHICVNVQGFAEYTYSFAHAFIAMYCMASLYYILSAINVKSWSEKEISYLRGIYACSATVSLVTGSATVLYIIPGYGDYGCLDALGVYSPNPQWAEWLTMAPLLAYMAIAVEEKPANLTWTDLIAIFRFGLCIFFGFLMVFPFDIVSGWVLFALSTISMTGNVVGAAIPKLRGAVSDKKQAFVPVWEKERAMMKSRLAFTLFISLPVFPVIYLLSYFNIIDKNQLLVGYMVAGFLTKFIFIALISTEASVLQVAAERRAAESRRNFLKYIFSEVRVPLNMLTMGISVLEQGAASNIDSQAVCAFMKSSTENMRIALNEVLLMSKQDADMRLELKRVNIHRLIEKAVCLVQKEADGKGVNLILEGFPRRTLPDPDADEPWDPYYSIRGDPMRLEHVILHMLAHAANCSPANSEVLIKLSLSGELPPLLEGVENEGDERSGPLYLQSSTPTSDAVTRQSQLSPLVVNAYALRPTSTEGPPTVNLMVSYLWAAVSPTSQQTIRIPILTGANSIIGPKGLARNTGFVVSDQIIKLHGGTTVQRSTVGGSSSFTLSLPICTARQMTVTDLANLAHGTGHASTQRGSQLPRGSPSAQGLAAETRRTKQSNVGMNNRKEDEARSMGVVENV